jgi:transposase
VSKARLVITAVIVEGRSQAETARAYSVSKGWVSKLVARYRAEGEAAFEPKSRRPHSSPNAVTSRMIELIVAIRKTLTERGLERLRRDRVDKASKITLRYQGQLYSIGVGRTHTGTHVLVLVRDLDIRIINAATGELLRELVLDPTRRYQSTRRPPGTHPEKRNQLLHQHRAAVAVAAEPRRVHDQRPPATVTIDRRVNTAVG